MNAAPLDLTGSDGFGLEHLPYGVFRRHGECGRVGVAVGEHVLDLVALGVEPAGPFAVPRLNEFMALGPCAWAATRATLQALLRSDERRARTRVESSLVPIGEVELLLPFEVADYVDFYSSLDHATNLGRLFRPDAEPLLPNWRHLPVGYHGRAGTVVVSGTPVRRPRGQSKAPDASAPSFGPTRRLDLELELGFVVGVPSELGEPVPVGRALEHVFGVVLVNDWSARDIQAWEYQPLGPFLGKSFATSIGAWVTPLEALLPYRVAAEPQEPAPPAYLQGAEHWVLDIALEVGLRSAGMAEPDVISRTSSRNLYWNVEQQIAHATVNGARLRRGDLLASGTISGPQAGARGSLIELTWNGAEPLALSDGSTRTFLADGDEVILRGRAGPIALGEVRGRIEPALANGRPGAP
ncbi:MAG: fumarylacetoacetase [Actinobacteria bacterium]|nr:fumarylacetoacetase [Actinomycetota bacterium]